MARAQVYTGKSSVEMDVVKSWHGARGVTTGIAIYQGRKFKVSHEGYNKWSILNQVRKFRPLRHIDEYGNEDYDLKGIVRDFIISQFLDGEEISPKLVDEQIYQAEAAYGDEKRYQEFYRVPRLNYLSKGAIPAIAEEVLIDLFCETDHANRVLSEENGVFSWQTR